MHVKTHISEIFEEISQGLLTGGFGKKIRVGVTLLGSEHGVLEVLDGAHEAASRNPDIEVVAIGPAPTSVTGDDPLHYADTGNCEKEVHEVMDTMLANGELDAAVTMHYNFPIGVSTVGRVVTPGFGRRMYIANTTGTSDTIRTAALLKNTIGAIAVAKACGLPKPTVGVLNIDGANSLERMLTNLKEKGYDIHFSESARADGGITMRGNDLLQGIPSIMVMDSLTGNVVMKTMSAFSTGGSYEALGDGYGPGVGEGYSKIVNIISRASGAPVIAGAIEFAAACAKGNLAEKVAAEYKSARKAGLDAILAKISEAPKASGAAAGGEEVKPPPEKVVTHEINGIEILELEDAVQALWKKGIYASSGMGCTGPVVMVATEDEASAMVALKEAGYL